MDYFSSNPIHTQDLALTFINEDEEEDASSPLDSPLEASSEDSSKGWAQMKSTRSAILSPLSASVSVLSKGGSEAPRADTRFLHGGPSLGDLEAPSIVIPSALLDSSTPVSSSSSWRAFTDSEEIELQAAWKRIRLKTSSTDEKVKDEVEGTDRKDEGVMSEDEADEEQDHIVPVGLDKLFSVNLRSLILTPDFWSGSPVRVIHSTWFYAPPTSTTSSQTPTASHLLKSYPVDPTLSTALEVAYNEIKPWEESYVHELGSALRLGKGGEGKLSLKLDLGAGPAGGEGIQVIFQDDRVARVYSTSLLGSMSKTFLTSGKAYGGGQVVLRGWEAVRNYGLKKKSKLNGIISQNIDPDTTATPTPTSSASTNLQPPSTPEAPKGPLESLFSSRPSTPIQKTSPTASSNPSDSPSTSTSSPAPSLFSSLKTALNSVYPYPANADKSVNDTEGAIRAPEEGVDERGGGDPGEVDELVLVVHGIGQKLAGSYDSLNFVYAVNELRTACTKLSLSPALAPLIHSKRAQFIPVRWRTDLEFDGKEEEEEDEEENLDNRFGLEDIEIDSVPILRKVVSGLVLDVPFYLSRHKEKMVAAVTKDANRIYRLFCARNPHFAKKGKVSIIAHSLGSALTADILSNQPTFVKPLEKMSREELRSDTSFIFDTRVLILVGSPLAFFLHLGRGQLIARRGRERTKDVAKDIALDRVGRYGCMAADSVYNVFSETDPVAFRLNPTVDVAYSKLIKPIAIPSTNQTLLQNLTDTYSRVSRLFDVSSYWSTESDKEKVEEKVLDDKKAEDERKGPPVVRVMAQRPGRMKRMPSERPNLGQREFILIDRAEKRFKALNPQGAVDFVLPAEGINHYVEALSSHGSYWGSKAFATFVLTQFFSSEADLSRTGRAEIGEE